MKLEKTMILNRIKTISILLIVLVNSSVSFAQEPIVTITSTDFSDKLNLLKGFKDKDWYIKNIPFLEVPDEQIQQIYHYRWFVYKMHLRYINKMHGYTVTEFADDPFWSAPYGGISCPAGHQIYEGRWIINQRYMDDYERYWANGPGHLESRNYSFWMADAYYARYLVNANKELLQNLVEDLVNNFNGWDDHYDSEMGMYWQIGHDDGMELSASSYRTSNHIRGGTGYRPTINAYMFGDAMAISKIYELLGNDKKREKFANKASDLKQKLHNELWDTDAGFFKHKYSEEVQGNLPFPSNKFFAKNSFVDAKELIGYVPWYFNMVDDDPKYIASWSLLFDDINGFYAKYGPTTLEKSHELYRYEDQRCCRWNGMSWPFANSQTLKAMANAINNYKYKGVLDKGKYIDILKVFTRTHYKNGKPYIAEAHNPDKPMWTYDARNHSEHYLHSSYTDLIITGLIGLRPRKDDILELNPLVPESWNYFLLENIPYHGHLFTILYDKNGLKYNKGLGLKIYQNGKKIYSQFGLEKVMVSISSPNLEKNYGIHKKDNSSANPDRNGFPKPSASFTSRYDNVWETVDGKLYFEPNPRSRWTTWSSPNSSDWFAMEYKTARSFEQVDIMFFDDGVGVKTPVNYTLQYWKDSKWTDVPNQKKFPKEPTADRNIITFPKLISNKLRVNLVPQTGSGVGIVEFETWCDSSPSIDVVDDDSNVFEVYPIPISGEFKLNIKGPPGKIKYALYNTLGQIVENDSLDGFTRTIKLKGLGIYILTLSNEKKMETKKIIIKQ